MIFDREDLGDNDAVCICALFYYILYLGGRKREILDYYYNEDYSLSEISELTGISRQGVRDSIKKSEEEIYAFEERLGLCAKNERILKAVSDLVFLSEDTKLDAEIKKKLRDIANALYDYKPDDTENGVLNVR